MITHTSPKKWVYLSPHLDDAALSCGGLIAHQTSEGISVEILTIFAGDPPAGTYSKFAAELHENWGLYDNPPALRREEDLISAGRLRARAIHLPLADCIYRRSDLDNRLLYKSEEAIFGSIQSEEDELVPRLAHIISEKVSDNYSVVCPLSIGGHVDHKLTRSAAELLDIPLLYYADYPYVLENDLWRATGSPIAPGEPWYEYTIALTEDDLTTWGDSVEPFVSQIPLFWRDEGEMRSAVRSYYQKSGNIQLWARIDNLP